MSSPGGARGADASATPRSWSLIDAVPDPCIVVTRRMEVVHVNEVARTLVPPEWLGRRCWEVFPVGAQSCAARCPAVRAVTAGDEIEYCEETIWPGGEPMPIGVAVIPVGSPGSDAYRAVLLLRPHAAGGDPAEQRAGLMADAGRLRRSLDAPAPAAQAAEA